jgi:hypothetical protein
MAMGQDLDEGKLDAGQSGSVKERQREKLLAGQVSKI